MMWYITVKYKYINTCSLRLNNTCIRTEPCGTNTTVWTVWTRSRQSTSSFLPVLKPLFFWQINTRRVSKEEQQTIWPNIEQNFCFKCGSWVNQSTRCRSAALILLHKHGITVFIFILFWLFHLSDVWMRLLTLWFTEQQIKLNGRVVEQNSETGTPLPAVGPTVSI